MKTLSITEINTIIESLEPMANATVNYAQLHSFAQKISQALVLANKETDPDTPVPPKTLPQAITHHLKANSTGRRFTDADQTDIENAIRSLNPLYLKNQPKGMLKSSVEIADMKSTLIRIRALPQQPDSIVMAQKLAQSALTRHGAL